MRKLRAIVVLTVVTSMVFGGIARADNVDGDGDGVTTSSGTTTLAFGNVCPNSTTNKDVNIRLSRQANVNSGHVFANSAVVGVAATLPASTTANGGSITLPGTWEGSPGNGTVLSSPIVSTVGLSVGSTTGAIAPRTIVYSASGTRAAAGGGGTLTRTLSLVVTATVVACDNTPPVLSLPANITQEAAGSSGNVVTFTATATDANPANPVVTCTPSSGSTFAIATTTVNCSATDAADNTANGSFTVTIQDTTPPAFSGVPADITAEAADATGAVVTYTDPTATDVVDGVRPVTCLPASGSTFPLDATTTVTCSASDTRGNLGNTTFDVFVDDTTVPVVVVPGAMTKEATSAAGAAVTFSASASDTVDGPLTPECTPPSGATFALDATTTVTCTATDAHENTGSGSFSITVVDTTGPDVSVPANITGEATSGAGRVVTFAASASDVVDGTVAVVCSPASGSTFPLGATTVNCGATDARGNPGSASFTVTIVDTTPPLLSLPADQLLEATGPSGAPAMFAASASDLVDGSVPVLCSATSGDVFPLGATTVNCSATDAAGNPATGSFTITVQDTTAPAFSGVPADMTVEATGPGGAVATYTDPTATDLVDGSRPVSCTPASGSTFALDTTTTVTCTASDETGNEGSATFTVSVVDTTGPAVAVPASITTGPTTPSGAVVTFSASATDLVDGPVSPVTCSPASGSTFGFGTTTVTCSAIDAHGNTGSNSFTVTVNGFTFHGFFQPVDMNATNTVKGGSTVPLKWRLFGEGGIEFTSTGTVMTGWPKSTQVNCQNVSPIEDAVESTTTGGTSLRYDTTGAQFIYNWQTPKKPGTCWITSVKFTDGSTRSAMFKLK